MKTAMYTTKKSLFPLLLLTLCFLLPGCSGKTDKEKALDQIREELSTVRKDLPKEMGGGMVWTGVEFSGNTLVYEYECPEDVVSGIILAEDVFKTQILSFLSDMGDAEKEICELCAKNDIGMEFVYRSSESGKKAKIKLTSEELKRGMKGGSSFGDSGDAEEEPAGDDSTYAALEAIVEKVNGECPQNTEDGLIWSSVTLNGDNVVYTYQFDEDVLPEEAMNSILHAYDEIKSNIISGLKDTNDAEMEAFLNLCKQNKVNVIFRYERPSTGEHNDITLTASELENL